MRMKCEDYRTDPIVIVSVLLSMACVGIVASEERGICEESITLPLAEDGQPVEIAQSQTTGVPAQPGQPALPEPRRRTLGDYSRSRQAVNQEIHYVDIGPFILNLRGPWQQLGSTETHAARKSRFGRLQELMKDYSGVGLDTEVRYFFGARLQPGGFFAAVLSSVPLETNSLAALKAEVPAKMEWKVRHGQVRRYLGMVEIDSETLPGFYVKQVGKGDEMAFSGVFEHKYLPNRFLQLLLVCPTGWTDTDGTDTFSNILKSIAYSTARRAITNGLPRWRASRTDTLFPHYDDDIVYSIEDRWRQLTEGKSFPRPGKISVKFRLRFDGTVDQFNVLQNDLGEAYAGLCQKAVLDGAPYAPWPLEMRRLMSSQYRDVRFIFYGD